MDPNNLVNKISAVGEKASGDPAWYRFYHFITEHLFIRTSSAMKSQHGQNSHREERDPPVHLGGQPGDPNADSRSNLFRNGDDGRRDERDRVTSPDQQDIDWPDRFVHRTGNPANAEYSWGDNTRSRTLYDQGQSNRGREPKGYQRFDEDIQGNVNENLSDESAPSPPTYATTYAKASVVKKASVGTPSPSPPSSL